MTQSFLFCLFLLFSSQIHFYFEKLLLLQELRLCAAVNYMNQYAKRLKTEVFKFLAAKYPTTCAD